MPCVRGLQMVGDSGFSEISITYDSPRGDDLDTRLLRAMVVKVPEDCSLQNLGISNSDPNSQKKSRQRTSALHSIIWALQNTMPPCTPARVTSFLGTSGGA